MSEIETRVAKHDEAIENLKNRIQEAREKDDKIFTHLDEIQKSLACLNTKVGILGEKLRQRATLYGFLGSLMSVLLVVIAVIVKYAFFP